LGPNVHRARRASGADSETSLTARSSMIAGFCSRRVQGVVATLLVDELFRGHRIWWPAVAGCRALARGQAVGPGPWVPPAQGPQGLRGQGRPQAVAAGDALAALRPEGRPRTLRGARREGRGGASRLRCALGAGGWSGRSGEELI